VSARASADRRTPASRGASHGLADEVLGQLEDVSRRAAAAALDGHHVERYSRSSRKVPARTAPQVAVAGAITARRRPLLSAPTGRTAESPAPAAAWPGAEASPDLVEEDGAAAASAKSPGRLAWPGEGAADVPEELALEQGSARRRSSPRRTGRRAGSPRGWRAPPALPVPVSPVSAPAPGTLPRARRRRGRLDLLAAADDARVEKRSRMALRSAGPRSDALLVEGPARKMTSSSTLNAWSGMVGPCRSTDRGVDGL